MKTAVIVCALVLASPTVAGAAAMEFRLGSTGGDCERCSWIAADGDITGTTPEDLDKFLAENPAAGPLIAFNSPGGDLITGMRLGSLIRSRGMWTTVGTTVADPSNRTKQRLDPGHCASACAYAFLGGVRRFAENGQVGVHQFYAGAEEAPAEGGEPAPAEPDPKDPNTYVPTDLGIGQTLSGAVLAYLIEMGASPEILAIASNMTPESMHFFTAEELQALRITTENDAANAWSLAVAGDGIEARVSVDRPWLARTDIGLFCEAGRRFLAYDFSFYEQPGEMVADIGLHVASLKFWLGDHSIAPTVEHFAFDGPRSSLRIRFGLTEQDFTDLADASEIAADLGSVPQQARRSFEIFHARLTGDPKAPMLSLKNCVG